MKIKNLHLTCCYEIFKSMYKAIDTVEVIVGPMLVRKVCADMVEVKFLKESTIRIDERVASIFCDKIYCLTEGKRHKFLYDSNNSKTIMTPGGLYMLTKNNNKKSCTLAAAYVKTDNFSRFAINLYMKLNLGAHPMQAFENREKALEWLNQF